MRILFITNGDSYSGSSIALDHLIQQLGENITCQVVFPRKHGDFSKMLENRGIKCHHLRYTMAIYPDRNLSWYQYFINFAYTIIINFIAVKRIKIIAKRFNPDIIHTNVGPIDLGYKVAKSIDIPHVWHIREYMGRNVGMVPIPSLSAYIAKYKENINHCIAVTNGVFDYFNLDNHNVCIYDGVIPDDKFTTLLPKENYFLFVGRLQENKGDISLLNAFIQYVKEGGKVNLYLAGLGDAKRINLLKNIVDNNNLGKRVFFLGFRSDVYSLMSKAKALFVPSISEGFGFITAEAMFNHCLVVGRNTTGTKEQFDNGLNLHGREIGIRFEKDEDIVEIMHNIENFNDLEMIKVAYQTVRSLYTFSKNAEQILKYYKNILQK